MDKTSTMNPPGLPPQPEVSAVAAAIRNYLAAHPQATDSAEGIHQWWISRGGVAPPIEVTVAALEQLERAGVIEQFQSGARQLWRRRVIAG